MYREHDDTPMKANQCLKRLNLAVRQFVRHFEHVLSLRVEAKAEISVSEFGLVETNAFQEHVYVPVCWSMA